MCTGWAPGPGWTTVRCIATGRCSTPGSGSICQFTYPPLAAIAFCPIAWMSFPAASVTMTLITVVLLLFSTVIVLTRLDVWTAPARWCLAAGLVGLAVIHLEPIESNLAFGQINVILMTLVIADCLPRRTPWPRGVLLGLAIALKLTPAVFLLYFALRRDARAALTAIAAFAIASLAGFVLAWRDSLQYWTATVRHTERIGSAALNTNQNIAGALARLPLSPAEEFLMWTLGCLAALAVSGVGSAAGAARRRAGAGADVHRVVRADGVAGVVVASLGVGAADGADHRRAGVSAQKLGVGGGDCRRVALMVWTPIDLLPQHREATASWWRQLLGASYVWWALAVIVIAGATRRRPGRRAAGASARRGRRPRGELMGIDQRAVDVDLVPVEGG